MLNKNLIPYSLSWTSTIIEESFNHLFKNNIFKFNLENFKLFEEKLSNNLLPDFIISTVQKEMSKNHYTYGYSIQNKFDSKNLDIEFFYNSKSNRILCLESLLLLESSRKKIDLQLRIEYTFELKYISTIQLSINSNSLNIFHTQPFTKFPTAKEKFIFDITNGEENIKDHCILLLQEYKDTKIINNEILTFLNVIDEDSELVNNINILMKNNEINTFLNQLYNIPKEVNKKAKNKYKIT